MRKLKRDAMQRISVWMKESGISSKQMTKDMVIEEVCGDLVSREKYEKLIGDMNSLEEIKLNLESLAKQWNDRKSLLQSQARLIGG